MSNTHNDSSIKIWEYQDVIQERLQILDYFNSVIKKLSTKKLKEKMKTMREFFDYVCKFGTDSVQGTAGIIATKDIRDPKQIVYKVSNCIDYSIEHESNVLDKLNELAKFCPHFMYKYSVINLPISGSFFTKPDKINGILKDSTTLSLTPVLFTEYLSKYTFYHAIKSYDKNIVCSLLLQIFSALKIAQNNMNFTHYDLHMDNILMRFCDVNDINLYIFSDNKELLVPTYGLVPVIIDMGSCHIKDQSHMLTSSDNYEDGLQSTSFDRLADIHHLLLSTFSCLEKYDPVFERLIYKICFMFYPTPLWKERGWKNLKYNLSRILKYTIRRHSKFVNVNESIQKDVYDELFNDVLAVLNGAIELPFKKQTIDETFEKKLTKKFEAFLTIFCNIIEFDSVECDPDAIFILKELVTAATSLKNQKDIKQRQHIINEMRLQITTILKDHEFRKIRINDMIESINELAEMIGSYYAYFEDQHNEVITACYEQCPQSINEFMDFFRQHIPCEYKITKDTNVCIYDEQNKTYIKKRLNMLQEDIEIFNKLSVKDKGIYIRKLLC